jgi:phage protein D
MGALIAMADASNRQFRISRPTINIGGQDSPGLAGGLLSLLIVENTNGLSRCEALFGNWGNIHSRIDFLYFDRNTLDFGKAFKVTLEADTIFEGKIMGLEANFPEGGPPELNVLAEDRFQDLRMTRRTRSFVDVSDADVINQIANEHGLRPRVDVTGPTYKVLAQINQSDLAFLRERVRAIDAELWMDGTTLNAQSRANRNGGTLQMTYGNQLREFSVLADLAWQRTSVTVSGWDVASKAELKYEATESIISGELNGDTSGTSILSSGFGPRKETLVHTVPLSSQEAQAEAEAAFKMHARRFVVGHGVAEADSRLRVGSYVDLQGLGPLFSGKYYLAEVRHLFDGTRGIRTEFTVERPGLGQVQS